MSYAMVATLSALPTELLTCIFGSTLMLATPYEWQDRTWHIATDSRRPPVEHALAKSNTTLREIVAAWFYGTFAFEYVSSAEGSHSASSAKEHAGHDLEAWLRHVGPHQSLIRKLRLEMHASELLMLFAPPEAAALLNLPPNRHVWTRILRLLKGLELEKLCIVVLGRCCPLPCRAGEKTSVGNYAATAEPDGSIPTHFENDHHWIVKAVSESMDHLPRRAVEFVRYGMAIQEDQVKGMKSCSWNVLHSSALAWHRCDVFAYEGLPESSWAKVRERRQLYKVPVVFSDTTANEALMDWASMDGTPAHPTTVDDTSVNPSLIDGRSGGSLIDDIATGNGIGALFRQ